MRYPIIIVSDLHLTHKEVDKYRWALFPWLLEQVKQNGIKELYILGDITDAKDRHPSLLVNRLVSALARIAYYIPVKIIKGNHDYIDSDNPFMEFINAIPNIEFYSRWQALDVPVSKKTTKQVLFLPHTRNHAADWQMLCFREYDYIFMHQTVGGSVAANGFELEEGDGGLKRNYFGRKVYSGDIHVPQIVGDVEYVGAPYPIKFGDSYKTRVLMLDLFNGKQEDLIYKTIRKDVIDLKKGQSINDIDLSKGDMVKVMIHLRKSDYHEWPIIKKKIADYLKEMEVICAGIEVKELKRVSLGLGDKVAPRNTVKDKTFSGMLESFADKEDLGEGFLEVGRSYL